MDSFPFTNRARSSMPINPSLPRPLTASGSKPAPSSAIVNTTVPFCKVSATEMCLALACLTIFCRLSCATRYTQEATSRGTEPGRAPFLNSTGIRSRSENSLHKARREANRDLRAAIAKKQFREDLYYRLAMIEIRMPSLAERKDESASPDAASP